MKSNQTFVSPTTRIKGRTPGASVSGIHSRSSVFSQYMSESTKISQCKLVQGLRKDLFLCFVTQKAASSLNIHNFISTFALFHSQSHTFMPKDYAYALAMAMIHWHKQWLWNTHWYILSQNNGSNTQADTLSVKQWPWHAGTFSVRQWLWYTHRLSRSNNGSIM